MNNLVIQQKISRSLIFATPIVHNFKKPEKWAMGEQLLRAYYNLLRLCVEANKEKGSKLPYLNQMDVELEILRTFVNTAVDPKVALISSGLHRDWTVQLNEIGKMLGGWIKSSSR